MEVRDNAEAGTEGVAGLPIGRSVRWVTYSRLRSRCLAWPLVAALAFGDLAGGQPYKSIAGPAPPPRRLSVPQIRRRLGIAAAAARISRNSHTSSMSRSYFTAAMVRTRSTMSSSSSRAFSWSRRSLDLSLHPSSKCQELLPCRSRCFPLLLPICLFLPAGGPAFLLPLANASAAALSSVFQLAVLSTWIEAEGFFDAIDVGNRGSSACSLKGWFDPTGRLRTMPGRAIWH